MCISEIAVVIGRNGRTVPLNEPETIVVFRRIRGVWRSDRTFPFSLEEKEGLRGLRQKMADLIAFLGECRTFIAESASGAVFFELEKARFSVWEIAGMPDEFLDAVWRVVKEEQEVSTLPAADAGIPAPFETAPGKFTISIKEIQGNRQVSSKQVLQQFIFGGGFTELAIICDHLPPWIEGEAERLGISVETGYTAPHEVRVLLKKPKEGACC